MKRIYISLMSLFLVLLFPLSAFAADSNTKIESASFEITLEEALAMADYSDIVTKNGITTIPVNLDVNDDVYTEIIITVNDLGRANAKSFSMEGWFRRKSDKQILTVYGLEGTFEYTGSKATPTGSDAYHNSALSGWTGSYSIDEETSDNGSASIIGNYTCYYNNSVNNSASCTAKCTKTGSISFSGNYDESTII